MGEKQEDRGQGAYSGGIQIVANVGMSRPNGRTFLRLELCKRIGKTFIYV